MEEYLILLFVMGCIGSGVVGYWVGYLREMRRTAFWRTAYARLVGSLSADSARDNVMRAGEMGREP